MIDDNGKFTRLHNAYTMFLKRNMTGHVSNTPDHLFSIFDTLMEHREWRLGESKAPHTVLFVHCHQLRGAKSFLLLLPKGLDAYFIFYMFLIPGWSIICLNFSPTTLTHDFVLLKYDFLVLILTCNTKISVTTNLENHNFLNLSLV
jgi:hypothetical protein